VKKAKEVRRETHKWLPILSSIEKTKKEIIEIKLLMFLLKTIIIRSSLLLNRVSTMKLI